MSIIQLLIIALVAYLIGSTPSAYFVTLVVRRINIFEVGSGNMGGTNVARTLGLGWGIFVACLDILKGFVAVIVGQLITGLPLMVSPTLELGMSATQMGPSVVAAVAAVAGHNWSFFATLLYTYYQKKFGIRGGKGAATAFGSMLAILPVFPWVFLMVIGISVALLTRYASLAVLVSFSITFLWIVAWSLLTDSVTTLHIVYVVLLSILIVWRFRENIERLVTGTERRLGERIA